MSRPVRRAALAASALVPPAPASAPAATTDFASTALNIIPSGQLASFPVPDGADRQARMYDALTARFDQVTSDDVHRDFKSERFGTKGQCPCRVEKVPRSGVRLVRDKYDVPHITAETDDALTWTAGWVIAEDRGLLLEETRYNSRLAAIDAPNLSAIGLIASVRTFTPSAQTETEVARQTRVVRAAGTRGRRLLHDIDTYVKGVNAQLRASKSAAKPWTRTDVYALNALKGQFLGQGGGDEARRSEFLAGLQQRLGPQSGQLVFDDLRQRDPADHPTTIGGTFPYATVPKSKAGNMVVDPNSLQPWQYTAAGGTSAPRPRREPSHRVADGDRRAREQHPHALGQPLLERPPAVRRRPADRLLLPRPDARDGHARARASTCAARPRRRSPATCSSAAGPTSPGRSRRRAPTSSTSSSRRSAAATTRTTCSRAGAAR